MPNESMYTSLYLSAGKDGFYVSEPGRYIVQAALHLADEDIVSNVFNLRVLPPRSYDEAAFGQELYVADVGRTLAFDGTQVMQDANDVLREAVDRFGKHPLATHARIALALPMTRTFRGLDAGDVAGEHASRLAFRGREAMPEEAGPLLKKALSEHPLESARALGHVDYSQYAAKYVAMLSTSGDAKAAKAERTSVIQTLAARGVKPSILEQVKAELA